MSIDYLSQTYEVKICKRTEDEYRQVMFSFFRKYYSVEQAERKVKAIDQEKGDNFLDRCLNYLTRFVYENLEKKRLRSIDDMMIACERGIKEYPVSGDRWLKEYIYFYFNSKYARTDYEVNGKSYSLTVDTDPNDGDGRDDFGIVQKYMDVVSASSENYDSSGSEIDNIKHLYGATLRCLSSHEDNAALQLLLTFCIAALGTGDNETLKFNAYKYYQEGFMQLYEKEGNAVWEHLDLFHSQLKVQEEDTFIKEKIIRDGKETIALLIHEEKFHAITQHYIS